MFLYLLRWKRSLKKIPWFWEDSILNFKIHEEGFSFKSEIGNLVWTYRKPFEVSGFDLFSEDESDVEGRVEVIDTEIHKTRSGVSSRAGRAAKRSKTPANTSTAKTRKRRSPSKMQEEKDLILKCCKICYPDSTELGEKIAPGIFDREMSKHRNQKHNIQETDSKLRLNSRFVWISNDDINGSSTLIQVRTDLWWIR